jgi:aminopeptidase N
MTQGWLITHQKALLLGIGLFSLTAYLLLRRNRAPLPVVNRDKLVPASLKSTEALKRAAALEQVRYNLQLQLTSQGFAGKAKIEFFCKSVDLLWLDLCVDQVMQVTIGGKPTAIDWRRHRLYLRDLKIGWNTVKVTYTSSYAHDMRGLHIFRDPEDSRTYVYSHCEPFNANKIYPCFDQPDIKAQFDLRVLTPPKWVAYSFSSVKESPGPGVTVFTQVKAMSTYLFFLCAGEWSASSVLTEWGKVHLLSRQSFAWNRQELQAIVHRGLSYFSTYFNLSYPNSQLTVLVVPELRGASAEGMQSLMLQEEVLTRPILSVVLTLLHELAHMWFGNLVTMKWWDDLWLKESFADFMSYFAVHRCFPEYPEVWQSFLNRKGWGYSNDQLPTTHPISNSITDAREVESCFDGIAFAKGAAVLKQLYFKVGDISFQKRLQRFMKHHLSANATLSDFLDVLDEELSYDLEDWAEVWLHTAGLNELTPVIHNSTVVESFSIVQTASLKQHPVLRPHKLKLELYDSCMQLMTRHTVDVLPDCSTDLDMFRGLQPPACVVLNVEDWAYCKVVLDSGSLEAIMKGGLNKLADPLTRQLLVRSLWDMVRDLKLSALEFVDVVRESLEDERSPYNVNYILEVTMSGLDRYVPAEHRASAFHKVFGTLLNKARSDVGLLRYLPHFLDHPEDFQFVLGDMARNSHELAFTQKDRWEVLKRYSSQTTEAQTYVELEAQQDKSFAGHLAQLYCENAYPSVESKAKWWNYYVTEGSALSSFESEVAMKGFVQKNQSELLNPYAEAYFTSLPSIFAKHSPQYATDFAVHLMPDYIPELQLIAGLSVSLESVPDELPGVKKHFFEKLNFLRRRAGGLRLSEYFLNPS